MNARRGEAPSVARCASTTARPGIRHRRETHVFPRNSETHLLKPREPLTRPHAFPQDRRGTNRRRRLYGCVFQAIVAGHFRRT